jgi:hypothetical protein
MDLREMAWCDDRINLAENRDQWRAVVNTVMNLGVLYNIRKFYSS